MRTHLQRIDIVLPLMKAFYSIGVIGMMITSSLFADAAPLPAIIVIRHASDLKANPNLGDGSNTNAWYASPPKVVANKPENWIKKSQNPYWPECRNLPAVIVHCDGSTSINDNTVRLPLHRLSDVSDNSPYCPTGRSGDDDAINLPQALLKRFNESNGYLPIREVITDNPEAVQNGVNLCKTKTWPTPNPFDTVYPFLSQNKVKLVLCDRDTNMGIDRSLVNVLKGIDLQKEDHSILICTTGENMWSHKSKKGLDRKMSLLSIFLGYDKDDSINPEPIKPMPVWASDVYVFTKTNSTGKPPFHLKVMKYNGKSIEE